MGDEFKTREIWVAKSRSSWGRSDGQSEYPLPNLIVFYQQQGFLLGFTPHNRTLTDQTA